MLVFYSEKRNQMKVAGVEYYYVYYVLLWFQYIWMRNSFLWRKIQLLLKRTVGIIEEDTITIGLESPGSQTAEGCTNILGKYHYMVLLRTLPFLVTDGLWLEPVKLVAPIWIHLSVCISSSDCDSFNTDRCLTYLAVTPLML